MVLQKKMFLSFLQTTSFREFCEIYRRSKTLRPFGMSKKSITQLTFACSKSIIETLEKGVKYVQS